jgi:hypothetical protein
MATGPDILELRADIEYLAQQVLLLRENLRLKEERKLSLESRMEALLLAANATLVGKTLSFSFRHDALDFGGEAVPDGTCDANTNQLGIQITGDRGRVIACHSRGGVAQTEFVVERGDCWRDGSLTFTVVYLSNGRIACFAPTDADASPVCVGWGRVSVGRSSYSGISLNVIHPVVARGW